MNRFHGILIDGYLALGNGAGSFREWIKSNVTNESMSLEILAQLFEIDDSRAEQHKALQALFKESNLEWPANASDESEFLQDLFIERYKHRQIDGKTLIRACNSIDWEYGRKNKYSGAWNYLLADIDTVDHGRVGHMFVLKGENIETEIRAYLSEVELL